MFGFTVEVRDKTLARLGLIRPEDLSITITERFNNVGEWTLTLPATHAMTATLRTPGAGIIVTRDDGTTLMSGPVVMPEAAASASDPGGTVKVSGVTDTVILADRLAYPQPSNVDPTTQTVSHDERTGTAEALMHAYVTANIGPTAPTARRDTRLTMGANLGRGPTVSKRARFPVLGALLNELAPVGELGFRVVQVGSNLEFQTYAVNDRSAEIRLDIANNTLASHKVATAPPGATHVIVAGPGELVDRSFAEVTTPDSLAAATAWGRRIEEFLDRRSDDPAELTQAGLDELADKGFAQTSVQAVPAADTSMRFGPDWFLGDRVTVVVEGAELSSVVTGYTLKADSDGYRIGTVLGDPTGFTTNAAGRVASVENRVSNLERNGEAASVTTSQVGFAGEVRMYAGSSTPAGWLLCDGTAVSRTTYADLFAAISTTYGVGNGSTTFNVPNLKGRVPVGRDAGQTEFDVLGETGGAKTHTLAAAEMPSHTHTQDAHAHTQPSHAHTQTGKYTTSTHTHSSVGGGAAEAPNPAGGFASGMGDTAAATPAINATTATNQSTGGGGAHNNLQPYIVLNYIIKT